MKYGQWALDATFKSIFPLLLYILFTFSSAFFTWAFFTFFRLHERQIWREWLWQCVCRPKKIGIEHSSDGKGFNPSEMQCDFELASQNSFKKCVPNATVYCCLFHFGQAVNRNIGSLGYKVNYNTDEEFALLVRCLCALSLIPPEDEISAYNELINMEEF